MMTTTSARRLLAVTAATAAVAVLVGCTTQQPVAPSPPIAANGEWTFVAGTDLDGEAFAESLTPPRVVITDGDISLFQPCVPGAVVPATSQSPCSAPTERFADAVAAITTLALDGTLLVATGADPELDLRFSPGAEVESGDLAGKWSQTGPAIDLESGPNALTIDANGSVSGRVLCTTFSGHLADSSPRTITGLEFAPGQCGWSRSDPFKDALEGEFLIEANDSSLSLLVSGDHEAITFEPVSDLLGLADIRGNWILSAGTDASGEIVGSTYASLTIMPKFIYGSDGCNSFGADQKHQKSAHELLPIKQRSSTLVGCFGAVNQFTDRYLTALEAVETAQIIDRSLVLRSGAIELRFEPILVSAG